MEGPNSLLPLISNLSTKKKLNNNKISYIDNKINKNIVAVFLLNDFVLNGIIIKIENDNYVLTNYHFLDEYNGKDKIKIKYQNKNLLETSIIFYSKELDLVLLEYKVTGNYGLDISKDFKYELLKRDSDVKINTSSYNNNVFNKIKCYNSKFLFHYNEELYFLTKFYLPYFVVNIDLGHGSSGSVVTLNENKIIGIILGPYQNNGNCRVIPSILIKKFIDEFIFHNSFKTKVYTFGLCGLFFLPNYKNNDNLVIEKTYEIKYNQNKIKTCKDSMLKVNDIIYKIDGNSILPKHKVDKSYDLGENNNKLINFVVFLKEFNSYVDINTYICLKKVERKNNLEHELLFDEIIKLDIKRRSREKEDYRLELLAREIYSLYNLGSYKYIKIYKYNEYIFKEIDYDDFMEWNMKQDKFFTKFIDKIEPFDNKKNKKYIRLIIEDKSILRKFSNDSSNIFNIDSDIYLVEEVNNIKIINIDHLKHLLLSDQNCLNKKNLIFKINNRNVCI